MLRTALLLTTFSLASSALLVHAQNLSHGIQAEAPPTWNVRLSGW